jgi:hypothetical protein
VSPAGAQCNCADKVIGLCFWQSEGTLVFKEKRWLGVVHTCNPSCSGGRGRRIMVQGQTQANVKSPSENSKQMDWGYGLISGLISWWSHTWWPYWEMVRLRSGPGWRKEALEHALRRVHLVPGPFLSCSLCFLAPGGLYCDGHTTCWFSIRFGWWPFGFAVWIMLLWTFCMSFCMNMCFPFSWMHMQQ